MTLEAAFIIPLFVFFVVIFIHVINLISFQNRLNEALYNSARTLSKMEYSTQNSANAGSALALLYGGLDGDVVENAGVKGGILGITVLQSEFDEDMICFEVDYYVGMPFDFLKILGFPCKQKVSIRKWIGNEDNGGGSETAGEGDKRLVYIAETGTVFHSDRNCTHLRLSITSVSKGDISGLRNNGGGKYYPCEICGGNGSVMYITEYGDRYHADINCSGLKRVVYTVPYETVSDRPACSRCGG
ncbi:MAG: pilus assembly protein [Alistipes sp.]|nr:pilus assembly protein [Alistipes sp.]